MIKRPKKDKFVMLRLTTKQFEQLQNHSVTNEIAAPELIRQLLANYLT